jgi:hypothetical protein
MEVKINARDVTIMSRNEAFSEDGFGLRVVSCCGNLLYATEEIRI